MGMIAGWAVLCALGFQVSTARASDELPGLKNPSSRIMVDENKTMPQKGTIGWGAALYRVESSPDISLAAIDGRLRRALKDGFARKGFKLVEDEPDYVVSFALAGGAEIDESELNALYGDFLEMPAAQTNGAEDVYYKRGVLIVDVVERETKHLMWRGAIMAEIDMAWPEKRKKERVDAAVGYLMRLFPRPVK
jgi:hypothetical protein